MNQQLPIDEDQSKELKITTIHKYLKELPYFVFGSLKVKIIKKAKATEYGLNPKYPKIKSTDPLVKHLKKKESLILGDFIAILRDYESINSSYYYYRMVVK